MIKNKIRVGFTHGDINGIGYEILIKALRNPEINELITPIVYGSAKVAAYHRKNLDIQNFSFNQILSVERANPKRPNLVNCVDNYISVDMGQVTAQAGQSALQSIQCALKDIKEGKIDVLVTAPIHKLAIHSDEFQFKGHTDYLKDFFESDEVLMFMVSENFKVGLVTEHISLGEVAANITKEKIISKLQLINKSLKNDFLILKPKIAVLGLNPHAGDSGVIGEEDEKIIVPAIKEANEQNIMAFGPFASDGFFGSENYKKFDATLAMYHDQGLIPFKTLSFGRGVNFTSGLPIVRTSPDHGVGFDIVGKGEASSTSLLQAIYTAIDIFRNRNLENKLNENPLVEDKK